MTTWLGGFGCGGLVAGADGGLAFALGAGARATGPGPRLLLGWGVGASARRVRLGGEGGVLPVCRPSAHRAGYPFLTWAYRLPEAGIEVEVEAWVPFAPQALGISNLPVAVFDLVLRGDRAQEIAIALGAPNPAGGGADEVGSGRFAQRDDLAVLHLRAGDLAAEQPLASAGDLALAALAGPEWRVGAWAGAAVDPPAGPGAWAGTVERGADAGWLRLAGALAAGRPARLRLAVAWNLPHGAAVGVREPLRYAVASTDAVATVRTLARDGDLLRRRAAAWAQALAATDLPRPVAAGLAARVVALAAGCWLLRDGRVRLCHEDFASSRADDDLMLLFPGIAAGALRERAARLSDGEDLAGFGLDLQRHWQLTGDRAFVADLWPAVIAELFRRRAADERLPEGAPAAALAELAAIHQDLAAIRILGEAASGATAPEHRMAEGEAVAAWRSWLGCEHRPARALLALLPPAFAGRLRAPLLATSGWGTVSLERRGGGLLAAIELAEGDLLLRELVLPASAGDGVVVRRAGHRLDAARRALGGASVVAFASDGRSDGCLLQPGLELTVELS